MTREGLSRERDCREVAHQTGVELNKLFFWQPHLTSRNAPLCGWRLKQHGADLPPLFSEFAGNEAKNLHLAGVPSVKRRSGCTGCSTASSTTCCARPYPGEEGSQ
jgi:hypothetical protein